MGFSNTVDTLNIANTAALAAAIGAAVPVPPSAAAIGTAVGAPSAGAIATAGNLTGARLVDNIPVQYGKQYTGVGDSFTADCSDAQSFELLLQPQTNGAAVGTLTVSVTWFDPVNGLPVTVLTYEINVPPSNGTRWTYIVDRCLGPQAVVSWISNNGVTTPNLAATLLTSSRPCDRPRIVEDGPLGTSSDGCLLHTGNLPLATGATDVMRFAQLGTGRVMLSVNGTNGQYRVRGGFGIAANAAFTVVTPVFPAASAQSQIYEFPSPNRPLAVTVTNIGAVSGVYSLDVWTVGD